MTVLMQRLMIGVVTLGTCGLLACARSAEAPPDGTSSAPAAAANTPPPPPSAIQIGQENVVTVAVGRVVVGPIISGELRPAREATVRAELGGAITAVLIEEGQRTRQGAVIARIETRTLDDARLSAASAVRSAESQLALSQREVTRAEQLVQAGALAARDLDLARANVSAVEAQLADAKSRLAAAERQLGDAVVRAPLTGVVSSRAVSAGEVVSPGTALFTVIDPSSMRLEAAVPSDDLSVLRPGAKVEFTVRGYEQTFVGTIERIAPQADPVTRQVSIHVSIPNAGGRLVAGLFAEGRVVSASASGLVVPLNAIDAGAGKPWALRVTGGKTERTEVALGLQDPRTELVQVVSGLNERDTVLRGASRAIPPGTPVQVTAPR